MKIPQRNVNLAAKLMRVAEHCLHTGQMLTAPDWEVTDNGLNQLQDTLLDGVAGIREYRRKVNPIEVKGQRL